MRLTVAARAPILPSVLINSASLAPLRHKQYRYFLGARFTSLLGGAIAPIAIAFAVLDISHSVAALGAVLAGRTITNVVLLLFGGVLSDRIRRDIVLVTANIVCFGSQAFAAFLLLNGNAQIWQIAVIEIVNGAAAAFTLPALQGIVPQLVTHDEIPQASALNGLTRNITMIGGSAVGGVIVGFAGSGWGLAIDAASFGIAAVLISRVRLNDQARPESRSMLRDLAEGWREFIARRWVWVIVVAFFVINAITGLMRTLGPAIADDSFGRVAWGTLSAAQGAGFVIGALIMLRWRPRRPMVVAMLAFLVDLPLMLMLGIHPAFLPLLVLFFLAGIGSDLFGIGWETALQQHIPHDKLSRVASYDMLGSIAAVPVGQLLAGPLATGFGTGPVIAVGGIVVAVAVLATLADSSVRGLRRLEPVEPPAAAVASG